MVLLLALACGTTPSTPTPGAGPGATAPGPAAPGPTPPGVSPPGGATPGAPAAADTPPGAGPAKHVDPKQDAALTPAQRLAWQDAMEAGRAAHKKKDYAGAVRHFDAALAVVPDDARALGERGWARLQAKELDAAEADTIAAMARTTDRNLLGSLWYNLGRVQEARGGKDAAAVSYQTSLVFRPNDTVQKRLAALGVAPADPWTATKLAGPWPDLEAWCAARKKALSASDGFETPVVACDPTGAELGDYEGPRATNGGPFVEVRVVAAGQPMFGDTLGGSGTVELSLALRTAAGWFTTEPLVSVYNPGAFGIFNSFLARSLTVERDRVVFAYSVEGHDSDMGINEIQEDSSSWLLVCGQGPAGPSCIDPVLTAWRSERRRLIEDEPEEPGIEHDFFKHAWLGTATLTPDGALEVGGPPNPDQPGLVGRHALTFP